MAATSENIKPQGSSVELKKITIDPLNLLLKVKNTEQYTENDLLQLKVLSGFINPQFHPEIHHFKKNTPYEITIDGNTYQVILSFTDLLRIRKTNQGITSPQTTEYNLFCLPHRWESNQSAQGSFGKFIEIPGYFIADPKLGVRPKTETTHKNKWGVKIFFKQGSREENVISELLFNARTGNQTHVKSSFVNSHNVYFMVMRRYSKTLDQLIQSDDFNPDDVFLWICELLQSYAQSFLLTENPTVHGDIKENNLCVDGNTLRFIDFGLSYISGKGDMQNLYSGGHYQYWHPYIGDKNVKTIKPQKEYDLYGLGIVIYLTLEKFNKTLKIRDVFDTPYDKILQCLELLLNAVHQSQKPGYQLIPHFEKAMQYALDAYKLHNKKEFILTQPVDRPDMSTLSWLIIQNQKHPTFVENYLNHSGDKTAYLKDFKNYDNNIELYFDYLYFLATDENEINILLEQTAAQVINADDLKLENRYLLAVSKFNFKNKNQRIWVSTFVKSVFEKRASPDSNIEDPKVIATLTMDYIPNKTMLYRLISQDRIDLVISMLEGAINSDLPHLSAKICFLNAMIPPSFLEILMLEYVSLILKSSMSQDEKQHLLMNLSDSIFNMSDIATRYELLTEFIQTLQSQPRNIREKNNAILGEVGLRFVKGVLCDQHLHATSKCFLIAIKSIAHCHLFHENKLMDRYYDAVLNSDLAYGSKEQLVSRINYYYQSQYQMPDNQAASSSQSTTQILKAR